MESIEFQGYTVYSDGRIWSNKGKGQWIKSFTQNRGYCFIRLCINKKLKPFYLHRLVLSLFNPIEGWEKLQVNHKDGDKLNCKLENLEWCTRKENMQHALHVIKTLPTGEKFWNSKLKKEHIQEIKDAYAKGNVTQQMLAEKYGCCRQNIGHILANRNWQHI
jgi:hypothetical protein